MAKMWWLFARILWSVVCWKFATEVHMWVEGTMRQFGVICVYCLYDLVVSMWYKKGANMKKKVSGKEYKGKICDEEELNVCLFNLSDHGKSGKWINCLCLCWCPIDSLYKWDWVLGIVRIVGVCQYVTLVSLCTYIEDFPAQGFPMHKIAKAKIEVFVSGCT